MNNSINKIVNITRNVAGALFIFIGLYLTIANSFVQGFVIILSGITLLPIVYKKIKFKYAPIILPITFMILSLACIPPSKSNDNAIETNTTVVTEEDKKIEIESLRFNESELELDIKEIKDIILEVSPNNAEIENLEYCTSDNQIATLEKTGVTNDENKITLQIKPSAEGRCEIFAKSINGIESNKVNIKIIDNERIQAEEQAKREAEEKAKQEAEEQAKRKAEEKAKQEAEEQSEREAEEKVEQKKQTQTSSNSSTSTSQKSDSNNSQGKAVYRTPNGKRYHYRPDCGGKNSYQTTLDKAKASGLTPCQKCVH